MEKYVPFEKLSKKKQKELNRKRRTQWALNPATRKPENSRAYRRHRAGSRDDGSSFPARFFS